MALQRLAARQRQLTRRLAETEESERRKISRELHDRVGQSLSSLLLSLEVLRQDPALCASVGVQRRLDDAHALTRKAIEDTRDLMSESRPPALDEFGLLAALRSHAEVFTARTGVKVSVRGGTPPPLSGIAQTALFRIAQEALVNVAKHAGATRVEVSLGSRQDGAELSIADNGRGFDPVLSERGSSWGLRTMRERAEAVGATLHIDSRRGGTTVSAWVPT
jgi:signal transduction histidine kinase